MKKLIKYRGNGQLQFNIPSSLVPIIINQGESRELELTDEDVKVLRQLGSIGVVIFPVGEPEVQNKSEEVKEPEVQNKSEEVKEPEVSEKKKDLKELMSMRASELKEMAEGMEIEYPEKASKEMIAKAIIEGTNGTAK